MSGTRQKEETQKARAVSAARDGETQPAPAIGGAWLAKIAFAGSCIFGFLSVLAIFLPAVRPALIWCDLLLFVLGSTAFLLSFWIAGRRALQGVGVHATGLYLAVFAAKRERRMFQWSFAGMVVLSLGVAILGSDPDPLLVGFPWSAWGILVSVFPLACAGLHGARYCAWPVGSPRQQG